ncbi:MAG: hypothetical protein IRY87_08845 [Acetobacteraceae bacterium]|nr:hypothetical protein [Acetobacteraceae bacterium]
MVLEAGEMLALGAAALVLACVSLLGAVNEAFAWCLRLAAWAMLVTAVMAAP